MRLTNQEIAEQGIILRCEVGSGVHGLALPGKDDRDEMGVCIEPPEYVIGLASFEQWVYRDKPEGVRSEPGDLDSVIYSLRKWMRLALAGNPSILLLLFTPQDSITVNTSWGQDLQALAPSIVSKRAGAKFLGYLEAQKQRLLKERGTAHVPNRGDRDAKYASHMLRLGYQGRELLSTGRITLPMPEREREHCLAVKRGEGSLDEALTTAGMLAREIKDLMDEPGGIIADEPDYKAVNDWLIYSYMSFWEHFLEVATVDRISSGRIICQ